MRLCLFSLLLAVAAIGIILAEDALASEGIISGHVYDADTKQPLSQTFVYCQEVKCSKPTTNSTGYYATDPCFFPSNAYTIECAKYGYEKSTNDIKTDANGNGEVNFYLKKTSITASSTLIPANVTKPAAITPPVNLTPSATRLHSLQGIWSVTGILREQITMALKQGDSGYLSGEAKYEPESRMSWNAVAAGSVSGGKVHVVIRLQNNNSSEIFPITLDGTYENDAIIGTFFEGNSSIKRGDFTATLVNHEIPEYVLAMPP